ncbi:MAG: hypothetical protein ABIH35_01750, partial [Patescibacteria group bacterium]
AATGEAIVWIMDVQTIPAILQLLGRSVKIDAKLPPAASAPEMSGILLIVVNAMAVIGKQIAAVTEARSFRIGARLRGRPAVINVIPETPPAVVVRGIL